MLRGRKVPLITAVVVGAIAVTYAASASTLFMPDSDSATLVAILANAIKTLETLNAQLGEVRNVYAETKRLASYADDSRQAFDALAHMDFARLEQMVEEAVPNAGYFGREARYGYKSWGHGSGELEMMVSLCLNDRERAWNAAARNDKAEKWRQDHQVTAPALGADPCDSLQRRLSGQEVLTALERMSGAPATAPGTQQAAEAQLSADAQQVRDIARAEKARSLSLMCQDVSDSYFDKCETAAMDAEVGSYQQLIELTDQVADLNRTEATRLLHETSDRERRQAEARQRGEILQQGIDALPSQALRVEAPGFTFADPQ